MSADRIRVTVPAEPVQSRPSGRGLAASLGAIRNGVDGRIMASRPNYPTREPRE